MSWPEHLPPALPALAVVCMFALAAWFGMDKEVRRVQVEGELTDAEQSEIMHLVGRSVKGGLLSADIDGLANELRDLSWPRWVAVRRQWPDTLVVTVRKAAVIAKWGDQQYVTSTGEVVSLAAPRQGLPQLNCAHAGPIDAMEMYRTLAAAAQTVRLGIVGLQQNLLGEWTVRFDNGVSLSLGANGVSNRMNRFVFAYARTLHADAASIAHVDARYANGLAVSFRKMIAGNSANAL